MADKRLDTFLKRFSLCEEAERDVRHDALDDLKFRFGDQWPDQFKHARSLDNKSCLTINRLPQFIRQVTNQQRQNRVGINVSPVDDKGDIDTAEVLQGIIRHIEYDSGADAAYDNAFEHAVTFGFGYWEICLDYESPYTSNKVLKIKRARNPFMYYFDPNCQEPDYSDAEFAFKFVSYTKDEFKQEFPKADLASLDNWRSIGDADPNWIGESTIRIAESYYCEYTDDAVIEVTNPAGEKREILESQLPKTIPSGIKLAKVRDTQIPQIKWCKFSQKEILEATDWIGKWIPWVPVLGDDADIDGKRHLEGLVRNAKDSQRMYNYWASKQTDTIALAPVAPWVGPEGFAEGHPEWRDANQRNYQYLEYKPTTIGGQMAPPPQRNVQEPAIAAITQARMETADDLKATTGIYDASLGARSNEQTGRAIIARQQQGDISNFHYIDNLSRSIRHSGRILIDLIPKVYDQPTVMRIIGEDGTPKQVKINQNFDKGGVETIYDLGVGTYDVTVSSGPSYNTRRQETAATMLDLFKSEPQLVSLLGDLFIKNLDTPWAQEAAERIKRTIPPQIVGDDENDTPIPPQVMQKMQQMGQMVQMLTDEVNRLTTQITTKQAELDSQERIAALTNQTKLAVAHAAEENKAAIAALTEEMAHIHKIMDVVSQQQMQTQSLEAQPSNGNGSSPSVGQ